MMLTNTLVYECGCSIPMVINPDNKPTEVKVNGAWDHQSKICNKHSNQVIELGRNWTKNIQS